ncbi:MAG TPA: metallophosphoesterase [Gemmataceae bacterium]|nr:metallophosphoesterase [Gemmataceae bacterium]
MSTAHRRLRVRAVLVLLLGCLAIAVLFIAGSLGLLLVGLLLILCGILEMVETFYAPENIQRRSAYLSGELTIITGILLMAKPQLVIRGLAIVLAGLLLVNGVTQLVTAWRTRVAGKPWIWALRGGVVNVILCVILATRWPVSGLTSVMILMGIHMLGTGWMLLTGRQESAADVPAPLPGGVHPDGRLKLPRHPEFEKLEGVFKTEEQGRRWIDIAWCFTFVVVFFAIHIGRMAVAWNLVGMISPFVATAGDVATALVISFGIVLPVRLGWRKLTRPLERRGWKRLLPSIDEGRRLGLRGRLSRRWLVSRMRFSRRLSKARSSPLTALHWGLQVGLPLTAILIAVIPIWGFSWFFNSEAWATGIWDRWAESRTDTWREQMILAVEEHYRGQGIPDEKMFAVDPEGLEGSTDFSFLVIGDTGEGGGAQHSLRDRFLFLGERPDVKFFVVSSDVIYPSGAMSDYEPKFYLPFKGFTKPIYAIPGNHDWYDALEAFAANFLEADAARACMRSRVETDKRLTITTDRRIDELTREAARLRSEFRIGTGHQRGPFFELHSERFSLIAVDTGVLRTVDTQQWEWLKAALGRAKGKFTMAILGHPLYAGGRYEGGADGPLAGEWTGQTAPAQALAGRAETKPFIAIHDLLRQHQVEIVMAGDTHYFEHYQETYVSDAGTRTMYHFVNGGGGAFISIGTPLDWPSVPAVPNCAYYPRKSVVIDKLDRETPALKVPIWQWVKRFNAWPFSAEALASAFNYNYAPYLQSFVEVRVEGSKDRVVVIPHGANGPLRGRELEAFGALVPTEDSWEDTVQFIIPMSKPRP